MVGTKTVSVKLDSGSSRPQGAGGLDNSNVSDAIASLLRSALAAEGSRPLRQRGRGFHPQRRRCGWTLRRSTSGTSSTSPRTASPRSSRAMTAAIMAGLVIGRRSSRPPYASLDDVPVADIWKNYTQRRPARLQPRRTRRIDEGETPRARKRTGKLTRPSSSTLRRPCRGRPRGRPPPGLAAYAGTRRGVVIEVQPADGRRLGVDSLAAYAANRTGSTERPLGRGRPGRRRRARRAIAKRRRGAHHRRHGPERHRPRCRPRPPGCVAGPEVRSSGRSSSPR